MTLLADPGVANIPAKKAWTTVAADWLPVLVLFLLAAYLRLDQIWLVQFKFDEAVLADRALSFVEGRYFPLSGNASAAGVLNPPGFVYLISLPLLFWPHPAAVSGFLAILGALAVALTYVLGNRYFGRTVGFSAGLLYAVNPWAVWFTRSIWEPDAVQPFAILFFLALYTFAIEGRRKALILSMLALTYLTQLHFSTVVFLPVWILAVVMGRRWFSRRHFAFGLVLCIAMYFPYLYGDASNGWPSLRALLAQPAGIAHLDLDPFSLTREFVRGFGYFLPDDLAGSELLSLLKMAVLRRGESYLVMIGLIASFWFAFKTQGPKRRAFLLLLVWTSLPLLISTRHWLNLQIHYFLTVLPALVLLAGVGVESIRSTFWRGVSSIISGIPRIGRVGRYLSRTVPNLILALSVVAIGYSQVQAYQLQLSRVAQGDRLRFNYGVPLQYTSDLAEYLVAEGETDIWALDATGDLAEGIRTLLRGKARVSKFDSRFSLPLPTPSGATYVVLEDNSPSARFLDHVAADRRVHRIMEGPTPVYSVYRLNGGMTDALLTGEFRQLSCILENGVEVLGYRIPREIIPGQTVELATLVRNDNRHQLDKDAPIAFAHLIDADNRGLAEGYEYGYAPSTVDLKGDWISWLTVRTPDYLPDGPYWVDWGVLGAAGTTDIAIFDQSGQPIGMRVRLGPMKVAKGSNQNIDPEHELVADFGGFIRLEGYDLSSSDIGEIRLTLHWNTLVSPDTDFQVFVHLLDNEGRIIGQRDGQPGLLPTSLWDVGDMVVDSHTLGPSPIIDAEIYRIEVGLYDPITGKRLPVTTPDENDQDSNTVVLVGYP